MLNKRWKQLPSHLALIIGTAAGALVCLWIIGFYAYTHTYRYLHTHSDNYGKAITTMVANQAIDAIINQDPISLQVILENVVGQPGVLQAVVADVNDRTIAQAGGDPTESAFAIYTAPVSLNNTIAGSVSISLLPSVGMTDKQWLSLMLLASLLLLAILGLALFKSAPKKARSSISIAISIDNPDLELLEQPTLDLLEQQVHHLNSQFYTRIHLMHDRLIKISGIADFQQAMSYSQRLVDDIANSPLVITMTIAGSEALELHEHLQGLCQQPPLDLRPDKTQIIVSKALLEQANLLSKMGQQDSHFIKIY